MLIGVISDSHDNLPNTAKALQHLEAQGAEMIIHCGDICTTETLEYIITVCELPIHVVFGNGDYHRDDLTALTSRFSHLTIHGEEGALTINDATIGWCHYPDQADTMAMTKKYNAVFHGHTHIPWEKKIGDCMVRNPGTVAGLRNKATCALYDTTTNRAKLIILELI